MGQCTPNLKKKLIREVYSGDHEVFNVLLVVSDLPIINNCMECDPYQAYPPHANGSREDLTENKGIAACVWALVRAFVLYFELDQCDFDGISTCLSM